jgi:hypothetical protein
VNRSPEPRRQSSEDVSPHPDGHRNQDQESVNLLDAVVHSRQREAGYQGRHARDTHRYEALSYGYTLGGEVIAHLVSRVRNAPSRSAHRTGGPPQDGARRPTQPLERRGQRFPR